MARYRFEATLLIVLAVGFLLPQLIENPYYFYAGFVVLQFVVIATGWNVLGGYAGYINFGAAAFFGTGVYTAVFLAKAFDAPIAVQILGALITGAALGGATGYLTLRIQGVYFAIATVALSVVMETLVVNSQYFGGARGIAMMSPPPPAWFKGQTQYAFCIILVLAVVSVFVARWIEYSYLGRGLRAIRANEAAAESCGVPTLRLKLVACAVSGGLLGIAGAPYPLYASYIEPSTAFSLSLSLNAIAMPLIGGRETWAGPVLGALLFSSVQQIATVTVSSELNILAVGVVLIAFVAAAPNGILGVLKSRLKRKAG